MDSGRPHYTARDGCHIAKAETPERARGGRRQARGSLIPDFVWPPLLVRASAPVQRPFPVEPIRTLDAIHLATAELLDEPPQLVTIVTRDERVRANAQALGYGIE